MGDRLGTPRAVDPFFLDRMCLNAFILFSVRQVSECMFAESIFALEMCSVNKLCLLLSLLALTLSLLALL